MLLRNGKHVVKNESGKKKLKNENTMPSYRFECFDGHERFYRYIQEPMSLETRRREFLRLWKY